MTLLELSEFVKTFETSRGHRRRAVACRPLAPPPPLPLPRGKDESTSFPRQLVKKIQVIRSSRGLVSGLGLMRPGPLV